VLRARFAFTVLIVFSSATAKGKDSVRIVTASPSAGTVLKRGEPVRFDVVVHYELTSEDSAILSLSLEQLRSSAGGCKLSGKARASAGELVLAVDIPIRRGSRDVDASLTWPGDTGKVTRDRVYGSGYVTFVPMYWKNANGARGARFRIFEETADYCYPFGQ